MPQFLRFRFPGDPLSAGYPSPESRARATAALFLAIPPTELSVGRLESAAMMLADPGWLEWTTGEPIGEQLSPWLHLVVAPGGRKAYLDCDPEAMAHSARAALQLPPRLA